MNLKYRPHFNDYVAVGFAAMLIIIFILGYKLNQSGTNCDSELMYQLKKSKENEDFLNNLIEKQNIKLIYLNNTKDSLINVNEEINKKRKINYKKYQDELKRNQNINTSNDANVVIDSILRSKGIRH